MLNVVYKCFSVKGKTTGNITKLETEYRNAQ